MLKRSLILLELELDRCCLVYRKGKTFETAVYPLTLVENFSFFGRDDVALTERTYEHYLFFRKEFVHFVIRVVEYYLRVFVGRLFAIDSQSPS